MGALRHDVRQLDRYRYPADVRFTYQRGKKTCVGRGRLQDFNRSAVSFEPDQRIEGEPEVEVRIDCPFALQGVMALDLVIRGKLLRNGPGLAVVQAESYSLQTKGARSFSGYSDSCGTSCNVLL